MRQVWTITATLIVTVSIVWLLILLNGEIEAHIRRGSSRATTGAGAALLRVLRRAVDLLILFGGFAAILRQLGIDPTPAIAGLGVGGIAVALAAQKTLENVIAGASLIVDQAVRVGDFLKMADVIGTVEHIGLRSTRIRTLDRTIVSVPNGQIANVTLETISARDKFWFHPIVALRYETTSDQLRTVMDGIKGLLEEHPLVEVDTVRVRFIRMGSFSLDIDVFAYVKARDWNEFLAIQEGLLFAVTEIVTEAGATVAIPAQTTYLASGPAAMLDQHSAALR
jgi:MscS family membrane protein